MSPAPRGTASSSLPGPGFTSQSDENRQEQILVEHLLHRAIDRLTDRPGTRHEFPWSPDQMVRIGVLAPTILPPDPDPDGDLDEDDGGGSKPSGSIAPPIDNRGVIGLDFVVDGATTGLTLEIDIEYALYHPLVPAFATTSAEAAIQSAAAAAKPKRRPSVAINPSWIRDNRSVHFAIDVPVDPSGDQTTSSSSIPGGDPLIADSRAGVDGHYAGPDALWKLKNSQTLPVAAALGTESEFRTALADRRDAGWAPGYPEPQLTVATMPTVDGKTAVSVSLTNALQLTGGAHPQDLALYDVQLIVHVVDPVVLVPQRLGFASQDVRYAEVATVAGRGRGCVARAGDTAEAIVAETLPVHIQNVAKFETHGADIEFATLADDYESTLSTIASAMRKFLLNWDLSAAQTPEERAALEHLRDQFEEEVERFELGCDLLAKDPNLSAAFLHANRSFARAATAAGRPKGAWRLFQLAFIVSELGALAGRENPTDTRLRQELDSVDVLWFPTGGGKTEAYLGLIAVALFYDRLRGKGQGTTAWLLFPLRMLSVQQLARVNHILHHAESVRTDKNLGGAPFVLGYFVGSGNTPNRLARPDRNSWWPGLDAFAKWGEDERKERRLVGSCPACGEADAVGLDADLADQRLIHVCRDCGHHLAIVASDEEVTRYQPAVVVSTVDKITAFARNGQLTAINRGPRKRCPQHGWYTHKDCIVDACTTDTTRHSDPKGFHDPTPALWIQDELHLVREDLGVFAAHYHTLLAELAAGAGHEPSKVIAATATIEQFEDQLSQVYGRRPRMFPVGGPTLDRSFYTCQTPDVQRLYLGVLPAGGGTVKVDLAGQITRMFVEDVHRLTDDPSDLIDALRRHGFAMSSSDAKDMLFNYELALTYVNSKAHGVVVQDDIQTLSDELFNANEDKVVVHYLMGEVSLSELAAVVAAVQDSTLATPRAERVRALVGTSVISHGVDLGRLNFEVLAGMPPSYAHYIQATARAGRSHVGLVVSVFDRANRRETSMYQSFATTHAALERMVEPVPVNRFASRAVNRTLPGVICALLWDETRDAAAGTLENIGMTRAFRPWWKAHEAALVPKLKDRIARAYRCPVPDPAMASEEQRLVDAALVREDVERQRMQEWQADWLTDLFTMPAMTSLRDVDNPVEFSGGLKADQVVARLQSR